MGFMSVTVGGSDNASDFAYTVSDKIGKAMLKELENESNEFNTPGCINVALFVEEILNSANHFCINESETINKAVRKCRKKLAREENKWDGIWGDTFTRLHGALDKFEKRSNI
jgi:hypothetical protein